MWNRTIVQLCCGGALLCAACGNDSATVAASGTVADASAQVDGATLTDGWEKNPDAAPPSDAWAWNADSQRWQGPDTAGSDGAGSDGAGSEVALSDASAGSDGQAADAPLSDGQAADSPQAGGDMAGGPADGGVAPVQDGGLGAKCVSQSQCNKGLYCIGAGTPTAYCGASACQTHADCAVATSDPMCCVAYQGKNMCLQQFGASQCGNQDKPPGADCSKGGQSDCASEGGGFCLNISNQAQCVKGCAGDPTVCPTGTACQTFQGGAAACIPFTKGVGDASSCAQKPIGGCDKGAWCIANGPGDPLAYCASLCKGDADCDSGFFCQAFSATQGVCHKYGTTAAGQSCAGDRWSCAKGLFCMSAETASATCTPLCQSDSDCADLQKAIGKAAYCLKGAGATGACYPKGDAKNGDNCSKDPTVCSPGAFCVGGYDVYNPDAYCQQSCTAPGTLCPPSSQCIAYTKSYAGCQVTGTKGQGESCVGAPTSCKASSLCVGPAGGEICAQLCKVGASPGGPDACPAGTWCSGWGDGGGSCLPAGTKPVGAACVGEPYACAPGTFCSTWGKGPGSTCIVACGAQGACPAGTDCKDFGQFGKFCEPLGGKGQGASCATTADCASGHVCIAAGTPHAICAKQCAKDTDCGATGGAAGGLWCGVGKWGGYCLPDGNLTQNQSCYLKAWQCSKGLVCIGDPSGNPGAFCSKECAGFAASCGPKTKCQYFGGGQSWCVPYGNQPAGTICTADPGVCDPSTLCVKGTPQPQCLQICGLGHPACPADKPCSYFPGSAIALCVPKGFTVGGAIITPL